MSEAERSEAALPDADAPATFRSVLLDRSFQALSLANFVSVAGDQIARVALSVLVYERTNSATLTGLTYAMSYLPSLLGGVLLSGLADRRPRRSLMVACDVVRAVLVLLMALPSLPLVLLLVLLAAVTLCEAPFDAARGALMPDVLPGERYALGGAVSQVVLQAAMVLGFSIGGALLVFATPRQLLALDASTFVVSALLICGIPQGRRRAEPGDTDDAAGRLADIRTAARIVLLDHRLRPLVLLAWFMSAAAVAPEALAAPYARSLHTSSSGVGILLAAGPVGNVLAGLVLARLPEARRVPLMWPLATLAAAPLALCLLHPSFVVVVTLLTLSGAGTAYHLVAMVRFVRLVEPHRRGRALGLASSGLIAAQGIALAVAGLLADALDPAIAIGIAGVGGLLASALGGPSLRERRADAAAHSPARPSP